MTNNHVKLAASSEPTEEEFASCLRILRQLADQPELGLAPDSSFKKIVAATSLVVRRLKSARRDESQSRDQAIRDESGIRTQRASKEYGKFLQVGSQPAQTNPTWKLDRNRACYVCKAPYETLHPFYDALCTTCGDVNFAKRGQTADLSGRRALVTGGRIKIGFQIALKLLRAGAEVAVTSRFPHDTVDRFAREDDFGDWSKRLRVYSADFRSLPAVESLCVDLIDQLPALDILVNNAAQTVRRPPEYYRHLLELEQRLAESFSADHRRAIADQRAPFESRLLPTDAVQSRHIAAVMSQVQLLADDGNHASSLFPHGTLDRDGQQVDRRSSNSWVQRLSHIAISELLEVHAVNSLVPLILIQRLEPLMRKADGDRFIINVSAVEGQFSVTSKSGFHVHTNMAKAGMNMITRTCSASYAKQGIYMNSVDTGWITNEFPLEKVERMQSEGFQPPLDEIDGAARVCDPIFVAMLHGTYHFGKFFKDYLERDW